MKNQWIYIILVAGSIFTTPIFAHVFYADINESSVETQVSKLSGSYLVSNDSSGLVKPCKGVLVQSYSEDHPAVDIAGRTNSPLFSMGDGVIIDTFRNQQFGIALRIKLDNGLELMYAHLENYQGENGNIREGQRVSAGERVGTMGTTGWSTGVHLHLEIRRNGRLIDPEPILRKIRE